MGRSCSRVIVRWQLVVLLIWFERPGNARIFGPSQRSCQSMCGNSSANGFRFQRMADHAWKRQGGMSVALIDSFAVSTAPLCRVLSVLLGIIGQGEQRKTPQNLMASRGAETFATSLYVKLVPKTRLELVQPVATTPSR